VYVKEWQQATEKRGFIAVILFREEQLLGREKQVD
jgi:hypothetical protein